MPGQLVGELGEGVGLLFCEAGEGLHDLIAEGGIEGGVFVARGGEDVVGEVAVVGALFDDGEIGGPLQAFPHFRELEREEAAEEWADADAGEVVASAAKGGAAGGVVAVLGMIEGLLHKPGERNGAACLDGGVEEMGERGLQERRFGGGVLGFNFSDHADAGGNVSGLDFTRSCT